MNRMRARSLGAYHAVQTRAAFDHDFARVPTALSRLVRRCQSSAPKSPTRRASAETLFLVRRLQKRDGRARLVEGLAWLRSTYLRHGAFVERDVVWTVQKWLTTEIAARGLPLRVFNDYGIEPGPRRSLSGDLVLLPLDSPLPVFVAEFKFEPSHRRTDIDRKKLPVVGWHGVVEDVARILRWVDGGLAAEGMAIFIDEGGFAHARRPPLDDCAWAYWGSYDTSTLDVWVHTYTRGPIPDAALT